MPTFDGGHYFLTALVPVRTDVVASGHTFTSAVHALRKQLDLLPAVPQSPHCTGEQSPFARNTRNHFVRLTIIDDVAYNGRVQQNAILEAIRGTNLLAAQHQDHLTCPFLLFAADFDASSGDDSERDSYLATLWATMQEELSKIFMFCTGFEQRVTDASSFAKYIASCQIETTMPFNDYYVSDPLDPQSVNPLSILPEWSASEYLWWAKLAIALAAIGLAVAFFWRGGGFLLFFIGLAALAFIAWRTYLSIMAAGEKPFPAAPDSNLPAVLKALHLQRAFTRFAIDTQMAAAAADGAGELYAAFGDFLAQTQPGNLDGPTQQPGVIGI
jgi:hypothetical protein